jgi:uncharacterized protein YrzB (UPF0473 family)
MEGKETLRITDEKGIEKEVEVLSYFTLKSNGKDYLIYTENKEDANGNVLTYTSEVIDAGDTIELKGIEDPDIINEIKEIIIETINAEE